MLNKNLFNGNWEISRQIINYEGDQPSAIARGTATFYRQSEATFLLHENVTVDWTNGTTSLATRSYLFKQTDNALLQYRFTRPINLLKNKQLDPTTMYEKILMHKLILQESKNKSALSSDTNSQCKAPVTWYNSLHYCGKDQYILSFKILSQDSFLMNYKIYGPVKNSYIHKKYTRE